MHSFPARLRTRMLSISPGQPGQSRTTNAVERFRSSSLAERDLKEPPEGFAEQELFFFELERCSLYTVTSGHG